MIKGVILWIQARATWRLQRLFNFLIFKFGFIDNVLQNYRSLLSLKVHEHYRGVVAFGLFAGLRIGNASTWSGSRDVGAKVLGLYEAQVLKRLEQLGPRSWFVDIGGADGYYAVGALIAGISKSSIMFEINRTDRGRARELSINNSVAESLEIHEAATTDSVLQVIGNLEGDGLILCDIEGGEYELFTEQLLSAGRDCVFIIELHQVNSATQIREFEFICRKFHDVECINGLSREFPSDSFTNTLTDNERVLLMSEGRQEAMNWLVLTPKSLQ